MAFELICQLLINFAQTLSQNVLARKIPLHIRIVPFDTFMIIIKQNPDRHFDQRLLLTALDAIRQIRDIFGRIGSNLFQAVISNNKSYDA